MMACNEEGTRRQMSQQTDVDGPGSEKSTLGLLSLPFELKELVCSYVEVEGITALSETHHEWRPVADSVGYRKLCLKDPAMLKAFLIQQVHSQSFEASLYGQDAQALIEAARTGDIKRLGKSYGWYSMAKPPPAPPFIPAISVKTLVLSKETIQEDQAYLEILGRLCSNVTEVRIEHSFTHNDELNLDGLGHFKGITPLYTVPTLQNNGTWRYPERLSMIESIVFKAASTEIQAVFSRYHYTRCFKVVHDGGRSPEVTFAVVYPEGPGDPPLTYFGATMSEPSKVWARYHDGPSAVASGGSETPTLELHTARFPVSQLHDPGASLAQSRRVQELQLTRLRDPDFYGAMRTRSLWPIAALRESSLF